jgi:hypothetical protein
MESGTVIAVSGDGGLIKVRSATTVTVIEMLGDEGELCVGDLVRGKWTSLGGETIYRNGQAFDVFIQDFA